MAARATMTALVWTGPFRAELRDEDVPKPARDEVLLAVRAVGVCGSDLHGYRGNSPLRVPPLVLGHEVVAADETGAAYIVNPLIGCGVCALCRTERPNLCPQRGLLGLDRPGAFADYVVAPRRNLVPLPSSMTAVEGTLVEPLATSINALRGVAIGEESVVVVIGAGPIGLLAAHAVRQRKPQLLVCIDRDPVRARYAGALSDVSETSPDAVRAVAAGAGDGLGAAVVIDAVGVEETWNLAAELVRPGGTVLELGLGQGAGGLPVGDLVRRGVTFRGVYAYRPQDFLDALALLETAPPPLEWLQTVPLSEGVETLASLAKGGQPVKAVFVPERAAA